MHVTLSRRKFTPEQLELRAKWKAALRSGEFKQTQGCLRRVRGGAIQGYCCLGVAAAVAGAEFKMSSHVSYKGGKPDHPELLPLDLLEDLSIDANDSNELAIANDGGATFPEIADALDAQERNAEQEAA